MKVLSDILRQRSDSVKLKKIGCGRQASGKNNTMAAILARITTGRISMARTVIASSRMVVRRARSPSVKLSNEKLLRKKSKS